LPAAPRFPIYEDLGDDTPLYFNPVRDLVAIALAQGAFRDFTSLDQILALRPAEDFLYELVLESPHWPFFAKMLKEGLTKEILTASWLMAELQELCSRAGYPNPITGHDIRAEALIKADRKFLRPLFSKLWPNNPSRI
jgi:hypothetical protein